MPYTDLAMPGIDLSVVPHCLEEGGDCRHIRLDLPGGAMRLDVVGAMPPDDVVTIEPAVDLGRALEPQLTSVRRLVAIVRGETSPQVDQRLVRLVEALRAADALAAGASLRDIGLGILGDDWPGDGEHLKSRVRRRVALAARLLRAGPRPILARTL